MNNTSAVRPLSTDQDGGNVTVGKDIFELLTSAMYVNPLSVYREYVQNSADAIDEARGVGLLSQDDLGTVHIDINYDDRWVRIRDNGIGVSNSEFYKRLTTFGASHKRGKHERGFRGIGRLAGLGYCQELIFRSRSHNDEDVLELRWDGRLLKRLLLDSGFDGGLNELVDEITSIRKIDGSSFPAHFFEIELIKPLRLPKDPLLNRELILDYLSQVAPVPFAKDFSYGSKITEFLEQRNVNLGNLHIHFNSSKEPLSRLFRDEFAISETTSDRATEIQTFVLSGHDGGIAAVGWLLHHGYMGALPSNLGIKGLRARVGNMQIGDENIFREFFSETRFNSWTVGEIHILDERISPNGRRDNFEQNTHYSNLVAQLKPITMDVAKSCRTSSQKRNRLKEFSFAELSIQENTRILKQGAISPDKAKRIRGDIGAAMATMKKVAGFEELCGHERKDLNTRFSVIETDISGDHGVNDGSSVLAQLPEADAKQFQTIIDLIYECSQNRAVAQALVDKILERLSIQEQEEV